jgi:hypothetical protein
MRPLLIHLSARLGQPTAISGARPERSSHPVASGMTSARLVMYPDLRERRAITAGFGGTVSGWVNTGSGFTSLLSASDLGFSSGRGGIEGSGNLTRLTGFKTGRLG